MSGTLTLTDFAFLSPNQPPPYRRQISKKFWFAIILVAVPAFFAARYFYAHRAPKLTDRDRIVLADFLNSTGDNVFDGPKSGHQWEYVTALLGGHAACVLCRTVEKPTDNRRTRRTHDRHAFFAIPTLHRSA